MSWLTIAWSMAAGACLTLAVVYFVVWAIDRRRAAHVMFSLTALSAAANGVLELFELRAQTIEQYERLMYWGHLPLALMIVTLVWFVRIHFQTGRRWLAVAITALWTLLLLLNFTSSHTIEFTRISELRVFPTLWGDTFAHVNGDLNPWRFLGDAASLLMIVFFVDASVTLWRQGNHRRAWVIGGSASVFILLAGIHTPLVDAGIVRTPYMVSFAFLAIVVAMGYELGLEVVQAGRFSQEVKANEHRWRSLLENVELAVVGVDIQGRVNYVNPCLNRLAGYGPEQMIGRPFVDFLPERERDRSRQALSEALASGPRPQSQWPLRCADGAERILSWSAVRLFDSDGVATGILAVGADVTDREQAMAALDAERERMSVILAALNTGLSLMDREFNVVWVNPQARQMIPRGELVGQKCYFLCEDRDTPCEGCGAVQAFQDGQVHETTRLNSLDHRWYHVVSLPIKDKAGTVIQVLESFTDISERVRTQTELERTRNEMERLTRANLLGELASALAHELSQPLAAILSNAQAMRRFLAAGEPPPEDLRAILDDIVRDDKRAGEVIHRLRAMLRRGPVQRERCHVNQIVREVMPILNSEFVTRQVAVQTELDDGLPPVEVGRVEIQQVLINLLMNALQAMQDTAVAQRAVTLQTRFENGRINVSVRDQGAGIPEDALPTIFDPFFTTRASGLGMGLAICRRLVEAHGGWMQARNHPDGGAEFSFTLPVSSGKGGAIA